MAESASPRDVVLVVEDDTDITELLTLYLNGGGYEVRAAGDGVDGLAALKQGGVSVVLVDIMMPRMNGYDFIRAARAFSDVPIVVVSARSQPGCAMIHVVAIQPEGQWSLVRAAEDTRFENGPERRKSP